MNYIKTKSKGALSLLFTFLLAFSMLAGNAPQLVYADGDTVIRQADALGGYDISFSNSNHTITYDETEGDGVITAVLGTYSGGIFTPLTADVTYSSENRELRWTGETGDPYALNITNSTGSAIGLRLPSSSTEVNISSGATQVQLLDSENSSHFEFFLINEPGNNPGNGPGNPPPVGNETANIRLSAELTWDTSERQDDELDMAFRIAHSDGDATEANNVFWERFHKGDHTGDVTNLNLGDFNNVNYNYVNEESTDKTRFWFGSSLLTKYTEITITSYENDDYTGSSESTTLYAASEAQSESDPIFFDYRLQNDVVDCLLRSFHLVPYHCQSRSILQHRSQTGIHISHTGTRL